MKALIAKYRFARHILGLPIKRAVKAALDRGFIQIGGNIFFDDNDEEEK